MRPARSGCRKRAVSSVWSPRWCEPVERSPVAILRGLNSQQALWWRLLAAASGTSYADALHVHLWHHCNYSPYFSTFQYLAEDFVPNIFSNCSFIAISPASFITVNISSLSPNSSFSFCGIKNALCTFVLGLV